MPKKVGNAGAYELQDDGVMSSLADDLFNLEGAVDSILNAFQNDIKHSVKNGTIPSDAGRIDININKKGNQYNLSIKSNGTGVDRNQLSNYLSVVGCSSKNAQDSHGIWILAPFCLNPENYILRSNQRGSDEHLSVVSAPSGFSVIEDGIEDETKYDFLGIKIELEIDSAEYTIPQIGSKIREVSSSNIDVPVVYEVRENGTTKKQRYINFDDN